MRMHYKAWFVLANQAQREINEAGLGRPTETRGHSGTESEFRRFDEAVTSGAIRKASRALFGDGHYARAVEEAFKCLNNEVKGRSGLSDRDGADLMRAAFSAKLPALKITDLVSLSDRNEHDGYRDIFAGSMTGIRNPRAHEHQLVDQPEVALELLTLANHLMRKLEGATHES